MSPTSSSCTLKQLNRVIDVFTKDMRSAVMRGIKSEGNKSTELTLIEIFREQGIRGWRRRYPVEGHPDFVFLEKRIAVFVDWCFWHGHNCRNTRPASNTAYWGKKREYNIRHDKQITIDFIYRGWSVLRIWECELRKENRSKLVRRLNRIFEKEQRSFPVRLL